MRSIMADDGEGSSWRTGKGLFALLAAVLDWVSSATEHPDTSAASRRERLRNKEAYSDEIKFAHACVH
jgi:hypothetical protein